MSDKCPPVDRCPTQDRIDDSDLPSPLEPEHSVAPFGRVTCTPCDDTTTNYSRAVRNWRLRVRKIRDRKIENVEDTLVCEDAFGNQYLQQSNTSLRTSLASGLIIFKGVPRSDVDDHPYVTAPPDVPVAEVAAVMEREWNITTPTIILEIISGKTSFNELTCGLPNEQHWKKLQQGFMEAANKTNMWIMTHGLNIGMSQFLGEIAHKEKLRRLSITCQRHPVQSAVRLPKLTLLGMVPESCLQNSEALDGRSFVTEITNDGNNVACGQFDLNPNHTHFVIVKDKEEPQCYSEFVLRFANFLRRRRTETVTTCAEELATNVTPSYESVLSKSKIPYIALLIAGGLSSISLVAKHLQHGIPVVVVKGSGGAADLLAFAYEEIKSKNRTSWDPDYLDRFIAEQLSKKIAERYVKYCDDEATRICFRDMIMECVRLSHCDDRVLLDFVDIHSSRCDLSLLNEYLLLAMFKAEKRECMDNQWHYYMQKDIFLALDWNCPHIFDMQMFQGDARQCSIEPKLFERALIRQGREEFVELFLDRGFKIYPFLTRRRYCRLFERADNADFYRAVCLDSALGYTACTQVDEISLTCNVNRIVFQLTRIKNFVKLQEHSLSRQSAVLDEHSPGEERRAFHALVVWAVLMNRHKLAKVLWKRSDYPIHLALFVSMLNNELALYITDKHVSKELEDNSREFAGLADGLLSASFNARNCRALEVLSEEVPEYNYKTAVEIAAMANNRSFIAQPCAQKWLTTLYYGDIRIRDMNFGVSPTPEWIKIVMSAFLFFPMNLWIIFRTGKTTGETHGYGYGGGSSGGYGFGDLLVDSESDAAIFNTDVLDRKCMIEGYPSPPVHLNLVETLGQTAEQKQLLHDDEQPVEPYFPFWRKIAAMWGAPITKFWTHQIFYVLYLTLFCLATAWPSCGNYYLDVALWCWTLLILFEIILVTCVHYRTFSSIRLGTGVIEIVIISLFLVTFMFARILSAQESYDLDIYMGPTLMNGYGARVVMCLGLLYFFYRYIWIYFPIDPTLGRMLYRLRLMVMYDFMHFLRLSLIFIVSCGIAMHAVIYPDYPMSWELWRRIFHKSWFTLFLTPVEDLHGEPSCCRYRGTDTCRIGPYESDTCPVTGIWPYLITIQYLIILKLILITLLFALFGDTAKKLSADADAIWRYQRYHLVLDFSARPRLPAPLNIISFIIILIRCCLNGSKCSYGASRREFTGSLTSHTGSGYLTDNCGDTYWRSLAKAYLEAEEQKCLNAKCSVKQMEKITTIVDLIEIMHATSRSFDVRMDQLQQSLDSTCAMVQAMCGPADKKKETCRHEDGAPSVF